jgi:DNA/RNA-binding domain of Phe-tRNA-synthetase-like protein
MILVKSETWSHGHPGSVVGMLILRGAAIGGNESALGPHRQRLEEELRCRFRSIAEVKSDPTLQTYKRYYGRFGKTYHVSQQLESVALKGKSLPSVFPLVEAFFMAELKNLLLTAGHDLAALLPPFEVGSAVAGERYVTMRGEERECKPGDMRISDTHGVISSIILGPDQRSSITTETRDAAFFVYAPDGIGEERCRSHLADIREYVRVFSPAATVEAIELVRAD